MSDSNSHDLAREIESLISRQFDGKLSLEEHERLQEWINSRPENAQEFVELAMLHDRLLRKVSQAAEVIDELVGDAPILPIVLTRNQNYIRWTIGVLSFGAALLLISFFIFQVFEGSPAMAAETQFEQLMENAGKSIDRTYLITSLDLRGDKRARESWNRNGHLNQSDRREPKAQAPVDGALLHVRGKNSYVLIRRFANGDKYTTGSDGKTSWSVPPQGRVRVSDTVERFGGRMPGNQHAIPFINLHDGLEQIRDAYDIQWPDTESNAREPISGQKCLVAIKKSAQHRGPKYVEIWFDSETGVIAEMLLDKLPRAKGGPETVLLELIDQSELPEKFFEYASHHDSSREVKYERN